MSDYSLSPVEKRIILIVLLTGSFMASLDRSIVNVSLPSMKEQFNCGIESIQWVITAYMICFCIFIPLTGWLRDKIGFFRLYLFSLSLFTIGSVLCALSNSLDMLIFSRVLQALGGGSLNPTALAILSTVFPAGERGKVIGWWGLGNVIGPALGPSIGGLLTHHFGWPSIFFINLPIGLITFAAAFRYLAFLDTRLRTHRPFDFKGYFFFTIFIVGLQYSISEMARLGIHAWSVFISFNASITALLLFIYTERNSKHPIIDLRIFRNSSFLACTALTIVRSAANFGGVFLIPFLLQGLLGYTELESGLLLLPNSLTIAVLMPIAGKWSDTHGSRGIVIVGLLILSLSMFLYSHLDIGTVVAIILLTTFIRGIGLGFLVAPLNAATMNSVQEHQIPMASSINTLTQQLGGSIGIGMLSFIYQKVSEHYTMIGYSIQQADHAGLKNCFYISMFLILIALIPAYFIPSNNYLPKEKVAAEG